MDYRVLQNGYHFMNRAMLLSGNLSDGPLVMRSVCQPKRFVENVGRHMVRVSYVANTHPIPNGLIAMT